jgi:simple sugar transport system substrate-binding protein
MSPLGPGVSEEARKKFDATLTEMMAGSFSVFKGPIKDNKGGDAVTAGQTFAEDAIELESMAYLVEGVVGSTS